MTQIAIDAAFDGGNIEVLAVDGNHTSSRSAKITVLSLPSGSIFA